MQNTLSAMTDSYNAQMNDLQTKLKQHRQSTVLSIQQIDEQMNALAAKKKKLQANSSKYSHAMNKKLNEFESQRKFLCAIKQKHEESIVQNKAASDEWKETLMEVMDLCGEQLETINIGSLSASTSERYPSHLSVESVL